MLLIQCPKKPKGSSPHDGEHYYLPVISEFVKIEFDHQTIPKLFFGYVLSTGVH